MDYFVLLLGRNIVAAAKYGLFKREHFTVLRNISLTKKMILLSLTIPNE